MMMQVMARAGKLMDRLENEKDGEELLHEWRKVSKVFDQFFFYLICIVTTTCTVLMLLVAPRFAGQTLHLPHSFGEDQEAQP